MARSRTLDVDLSGAERAFESLDSLSERGVLFAAKDALRGTTAEAQHEWREELAEKLTLRNRWTKGSIRTTRPRGSTLGSVRAVVGSLADYMATTESGGTLTTQGKHGRPIPTDAARVAGSSKRLVARRNRMRRITLGKTTRGTGSRSQRIAIALKQARESGQRYVLIETQRGANIYSISGRTGKRPKLTRIWNLEERTVRVPAHPTMRAPMLRAQSNFGRRFGVALRAQLARRGWR